MAVAARPRPAGRRTLAVALVLAAIAVIAAAACTRWPVPGALVQRLAAERLQRTVTISEDATFCLCPRPTLTAAAIEVGPPPWSDASHFARAADVAVRLGLASLLGGRLHVVDATIGRGDVALERRADGSASWQLPPGRDPRDERGDPPRIDRLEVRELAWRFVDPSLRADLSGTLSLVDGADRAAADDPAQRPRLALQAGGTLRGLPVDARVEGGGVLPGDTGTPRALKARATVGEGRLRFDGEADALASLQGLRGEYRVSGPALAALGSLFGAVLPRTPAFRIDGRLRRVGERWELAIARATVGGSDLRGDVRFTPARGEASARLDGALESTRMRIVDLGRSVGFGEKGPARSGRVLPDVSLDLPSLRDMDAKVGLRVARLELGAGTAPITDLAVAVRLENAVLALGELEASVAGGRLDGDVRIDATDRPGRVRASLRVRQVELAKWLPKLRGEPPIASRLNAELTVRGRGDSVADVLARADGRARLALGPGEASRLLLEAAGLDVAEALAVLSTRDRSVRLDCGLADVAIERGVMTPQVMFVDTRDTILTAQGTVDLGRERLAMRIRAAPRDFSPLTLRSPIDVGGSFADPAVSVDRTRIAGTVIASVVLGAVVTPIAALLPLLDFGEGDPPSPCTDRYGPGSKRDAANPPAPPSPSTAPPTPSPAPTRRSAAR